MLENLFTNVFGRPKNRSSNRHPQHDQTGTSSASQMSGPFSASTPQMPQAPNLPYPIAPYPPPSASGPAPTASTYYPSLPFSQPSLPGAYASSPAAPSSSGQPFNYPTSTLPNQISPLDSVPFEAKLTLNSSTTLVSLDQLFNEIKKASDVVDRADAYLRSSQSDYDFKIEQGLLY